MAKALRTITVRPAPEYGMRPGPFTYYVVNLGNGKVRLSRDPDGKFGPVMPAASVKHFIDDLACKVRVPGKSGHPAVDAVLAGRAECLGKGDDGFVFRVGDKVVKVSTTVPYHPENSPHMSPKQAKDRLRAQVALANRLADLGITGVQRSEFVEHGGKGFQVKPYVEIPARFTREQLDEIQDTLIAMHRAGVALRDFVQAGIDPSTGRPVLFDTGKAETIPPGDEKLRHYSMVERDMSHLGSFYEASGQRLRRRDRQPLDTLWDDLKAMLAETPMSPESANAFVADISNDRRAMARETLEGEELAQTLRRIDMDERWELRRKREAERGFARVEALVFVAGGAVGFAAAPRLNATIRARPLGRRVPPSALASVGALVGAAVARKARMRRTAAAGFGLGVGLAAGTVASAKQPGGLLTE